MGRALLALFLVPWFSACTPLRMSAADVAKLGPGDGVVVGSVQIVVAPEPSSGWPVVLNLKDTTW